MSLVLAALIPVMTYLANNPTAKTSIASNATTPAPTLCSSNRQFAEALCKIPG
jgi:hypothetical protein